MPTYKALNCTCCSGPCLIHLCPSLASFPATITLTSGGLSGGCSSGGSFSFASPIHMVFTTTSAFITGGTGWEYVYVSPRDGFTYAVTIICQYNPNDGCVSLVLDFGECGDSTFSYPTGFASCAGPYPSSGNCATWNWVFNFGPTWSNNAPCCTGPGTSSETWTATAP